MSSWVCIGNISGSVRWGIGGRQQGPASFIGNRGVRSAILRSFGSVPGIKLGYEPGKTNGMLIPKRTARVNRMGSGFGVWGEAVSAFPVFLQPFARAFHANSHPVAARPYGGPTAPVILGASRECIP